ncbi:MarR family transcriptional regulator [Terrabacter sp. NPDC000476]|uniref:MarR family winged helix-turn-helix transcriptional regulator n=1 Tax=Terrabacter sp. NPDC000476 TaxID=3154258 RepID=UPI003326298B
MNRTAVSRQVDEWALAGLLGRFGHDLTSLVDKHLGSDWAENDEILALLALRHDMGPTTREIAQLSGLHRRALSRLVTRLRQDGIVLIRTSSGDRRSVVVDLTQYGKACFDGLSQDVDELFRTHHQTAARICELLDCGHHVPGQQHDPLGLLEQLVRAGDDLVRSIDSAAGPASLSGSQRTALVRIAAEGGLRPVELVPTLGFGRSGVAYVVNRLCDKGLVQRERNGVEGDARAVMLTVTAEGRAAAVSVTKAAAMHRLRLGPLFAQVRDWE